MTKTDRNVVDCTFEINKHRLRVEDHHRCFKDLIDHDEFDVEKRNIDELIQGLNRMVVSLQMFATELQKVSKGS